MPSTSIYNPFDQANQIELPNDLSTLTSMSVSGSALTIVIQLSSHRSYNASPNVLLLSTATQGTMSIAVGQTLKDPFGSAV